MEFAKGEYNCFNCKGKNHEKEEAGRSIGQ